MTVQIKRKEGDGQRITTCGYCGYKNKLYLVKKHQKERGIHYD